MGAWLAYLARGRCLGLHSSLGLPCLCMTQVTYHASMVCMHRAMGGLPVSVWAVCQVPEQVLAKQSALLDSSEFVRESTRERVRGLLKSATKVGGAASVIALLKAGDDQHACSRVMAFDSTLGCQQLGETALSASGQSNVKPDVSISRADKQPHGSGARKQWPPVDQRRGAEPLQGRIPQGVNPRLVSRRLVLHHVRAGA